MVNCTTYTFLLQLAVQYAAFVVVSLQSIATKVENLHVSLIVERISDALLTIS